MSEFLPSQPPQNDRIHENTMPGAWPVDYILAELVDTSKPWYQSRTLVALVAALIITALQQFDLLPGWMPQDALVNVLMSGAPIAVAMWGRIVSTAAIGPQPPLQQAEQAMSFLASEDAALLTSKTNTWYAVKLTLALILGVTFVIAAFLIFRDVAAAPSLVEQSRAAMTPLQQELRDPR
jgi:hypothetical protein